MDKLKPFLVYTLFIGLCYGAPAENCPPNCECTESEIMCKNFRFTAVPQVMSTTVETLDLSNNSLREISRDNFEIYSTVHTLWLPYNKIERLDDSAFGSNEGLMKLNLAYNRLESLYEQTFMGLDQLRYLNLTGNLLVEVFTCLRSLPKLRELYLGYNKITEIPEDSFIGSYNLRILDLRNNEISSIHPDVFSSLSHLRFLILKNNPLHNAASDMDISKNEWLHVLDMTNCKIEREMRELPKRVRDVRLSNNNITSIKSMFKNGSYVDMIILNNNNISSIDEQALKNLPYLREIWLNRNKLRAFPVLPPYLRAVHVDDNEIESVDSGSFSVTPFVEIVSLQNNRITRLPSESFRNLRIRMIDVSMNQIAILQRYTFSNLPVLFSLDLSKNPIQRLDTHSFDNVTNLHWLQMARTSTDVEVDSLEMLHTMTKLQYLDLSSSPGLARKLINSNVVLNEVRTLNLMYNDLITLPVSFSEQVPNAQVIHLSGNKWHCNASLAWLPDFIRENEKMFLAKKHIVCYTPIEMRYMPIYELDAEKLEAITGPPFVDVQPCPECKEPCDTAEEGGAETTGEGTNGEPLIPEEERGSEGGVDIEEASVDGDLGPEPANLETESEQADEFVAENLKVKKTEEAETDQSIAESPSRIGKILGKVPEGASTSARESLPRIRTTPVAIGTNDDSQSRAEAPNEEAHPGDVTNEQPITDSVAEPEQPIVNAENADALVMNAPANENAETGDEINAPANGNAATSDVINAPVNENAETGDVINAPANENVQNDAVSDDTTSAEKREIEREEQKEKDEQVWAMMARMFKF